LLGLVLAVVAGALILKTVSPMILLLPIYMVFVGLLGVGVGWIASSLHVYLRDTGQVLTVVMTLWFWFTPIMINEEQIPRRFVRGSIGTRCRGWCGRIGIGCYRRAGRRLRSWGAGGVFGGVFRDGWVIFSAFEAGIRGCAVARRLQTKLLSINERSLGLPTHTCTSAAPTKGGQSLAAVAGHQT
jgi:hypothetical protein